MAEAFPTSALMAHLRNCRLNADLGYTAWTVEAEFPLDPSWYKAHGMKPRTGRVYASLFNAGTEVRLNDESARNFMSLLLLTGAHCESWLTTYDDTPDSDDEPGFEFEDVDGHTRPSTPAFAGRLWTFGRVGEVDPDIRIADWSQRDCGSVNYFASEHGKYHHVI